MSDLALLIFAFRNMWLMILAFLCYHYFYVTKSIVD